MLGFGGILDTSWAWGLQMTKNKLIDGKKLWVRLEVR